MTQTNTNRYGFVEGTPFAILENFKNVIIQERVAVVSAQIHLWQGISNKCAVFTTSSLSFAYQCRGDIFLKMRKGASMDFFLS